MMRIIPQAWWIALGLWLAQNEYNGCDGFVHQPWAAISNQITTTTTSSSIPLKAVYDSRNYPNSNDDELQRRRQERTCIQHFLTQRTIQTFMMLCVECRDPHKVQYLDDFGSSKDLLQFHGTGGMNTTLFPSPTSYFNNLLDQNKETIIIQAKRRGAGTGGWSKNNPYLQPRFVEYPLELDPLTMVQRMLVIREQLAAEWVADLDVVTMSGAAIMDSYMATLRQEFKTSTNSNTTSNNNGPHTSPPPWYKTEPTQTYSTGLPPPQPQAFERSGPFFLRNQLAFRERASSALRGGNFDLLVLLTTQEAIHRLLRDGVSGKEFLRDFYTQHCAQYFDGSGEHGRADDFMELLMTTPPKVSRTGQLVMDPLGLAEQILNMRQTVVEDWKQLLETSKSIQIMDEATGEVLSTTGAPDHEALRRKLHQRQQLVQELAVEDDDEEDEKDLGGVQPADAATSSTWTSTTTEPDDFYGEFQ